MKQQIHFVTGKGGVGKSLIAASLALKLSKEGKKVLLVELGDQSFYKDFFELPSVAFTPTAMAENLSVALWSGQECLQEYAKYLVKVETLANLFFENAIMRTFINVAPGLSELAILGKITSSPRQHGPPLPYDCLVVDAFATGHFLALLEAPRGMAQAIQFGPMGEQSRGIEKVLKDQSLCSYHVVTLAEELPMKEASELIEKLKTDFEVEPDVIVNKVIPQVLPLDELKKASQGGDDLAHFASYLLQQTLHQKNIISRLEGLKVKFKTVPLFFESEPWALSSKMSQDL